MHCHVGCILSAGSMALLEGGVLLQLVISEWLWSCCPAKLEQTLSFKSRNQGDVHYKRGSNLALTPAWQSR